MNDNHVIHHREVGPNQTVTGAPARRRWDQIEPSHRGQIRLSEPQRAELAREADRETILAWAQANPGSTREEAAEALGMKPWQLHAAIGAEGGALFVRPPASSERVYSEAAIIRHLQAAAAVMGNPLSKSDYDAYLEAQGGISSVRILQRFGGRWSAACIAAGLLTNAPLRRVYSRRWSPADLVLHVVDYLESDEATGSYADYDRWARLGASRPSSQTVRNYLGPWAEAKRIALAEQARLHHDFLARAA